MAAPHFRHLDHLGRNPIYMVVYLAFPVAVILGFLAGLGVGGGSLLMLWLTAVAGVTYADARFINLMFFLPSALMATIFHCKHGNLPFRKILPAILCGCAAAAIFSFMGRQFNTDIIKRIFGGLLILTGLRELFYRPRKAK